MSEGTEIVIPKDTILTINGLTGCVGNENFHFQVPFDNIDEVAENLAIAGLLSAANLTDEVDGVTYAFDSRGKRYPVPTDDAPKKKKK